MELYELKNIIMEMAELGAANYAKMIAPASDNLSQREAYRMFGEARVKRWAKAGIIHKVRSGTTIRSKIIYSRAELMAAWIFDSLIICCKFILFFVWRKIFHLK